MCEEDNDEEEDNMDFGRGRLKSVLVVEEITKKMVMTATDLVTVMVMMILPLDTGLVSDCSTVLPPPPSMCNVVLSGCLPEY